MKRKKNHKKQRHLYRKYSVIFLFIFFAVLIGYQCLSLEKKEKKKNDLINCCFQTQYLNKKFEHIPKTAYEAFNMPYYYLGRGKQAIAFASMDGQYVLKLFKWPKKQKKQKALSESLYLVDTNLKKECGIIAIQYGPSSSDCNNIPPIQALNSRGKIITIHLKEHLFVLQKRAPLSLKETLFKLKWQNRIEEGEKVIKSFFALLHSIRSKGLIDLDGSLIRNGNIALIKNSNNCYTSLSIDIGKYSKSEQDQITNNDIKRLKPLISWIKNAWPELLPKYIKIEAAYRKKLTTYFEVRNFEIIE